MEIRCTKVFARFINETAKKQGFSACARLVWLPENSYSFITGNDIINAVFDGDYNRDRGAACAICVEYPADFYAVPRYLTTTELLQEFRRRRVSDWAGLVSMVRDLCEI